MIYVAAPFWHEDVKVREARRKAAILYSEQLFFKGKLFYSPLLYTERFSEKKQKENFWLNHGLKMVEVCTSMHVMCLEDWEKSGGVQGEIKVAENLDIPITYITMHSRVSFHGSRSLTKEQCLPVFKDVIKRCQVQSIITHGEPHGVCEFARQFAEQKTISLKLHYLQKHRMAGMFHWRSVAVLEDAEKAVFLHDGVSDGTANEFALCKKMDLAYEYYRLHNGVLVLVETELSENENAQIDGVFDKFEKKLDKATRNSTEYRAFRTGVLKRDGHKCVFCGSEENICVHHIIPFAKNNELTIDKSNGQTLCVACHMGVHGKKHIK